MRHFVWGAVTVASYHLYAGILSLQVEDRKLFLYIIKKYIYLGPQVYLAEAVLHGVMGRISNHEGVVGLCVLYWVVFPSPFALEPLAVLMT